MSLVCEYKKCRRSGLFPVFLAGGLLAAAVPAMNMFFRSELYLHRPQTPLTILLEANWQMMGMLNLFLVLAGASVLYHMEFADRAFLRMETPVSYTHLDVYKRQHIISECILVYNIWRNNRRFGLGMDGLCGTCRIPELSCGCLLYTSRCV